MNQIIYAGKHTLTMAVSRHIHTSWELIFCTGGSGRLIFDDKVLDYTKNDIAVIPPFLPHSNESEEGFTNIHLNLADPGFNETEPFIISADSNGFLFNAFTAAFYYYSKSSASYALLSIYGQLIATTLAMYQPEYSRSEIVQKIENHILQNYPDCNYDLNTYLESLPFSSEYLKKLFRKETGLTPHQYLTDKRLANAANNLAMYDGKGNISETARLCGFKEPLYFSRLFKKKYGVSPRNFTSENIPKPDVTADSDSMKIML